MISGVATVWVPVTDIERAVDFYSQTLGLEVEQQDGDWAMLSAQGSKIGLNAEEAEGAGVDGGPVIAFRPEDGIETAIEGLRSNGVEIAAEISDHPWGRVATFKDSEGNDLQLYVPPEG